MRKIIPFLTFLLLVSSYVWAQENSFARPSSTKEVRDLIRSAEKAFGKQPEEGIAQMKEVITYCVEHEYDSINIFNAHFNLGILYFQLPDMDSALCSFRNCLNIAKKRNDDFFFYKTYLGFSRVYSYLGKYDSTQHYTEKGLNHCKTIGYERGIANNYNQLGVLAGRRGDIGKATYYKEKSFEMAKEQQDTIGVFYAAYNLAIHFQTSKLYQKSLEYSIYVQEIAQQTGSSFQLGMASSVLGKIYSILGDEEKALEYIKVAIEAHLQAIREADGEAHMEWVAFEYLKRGDIYNKLDSTQKARDFIKKALVYFDSTSFSKYRASAYASYSNSHRYEGNYDSAMYYALIAKDLGNSSSDVLEKMEGNLVLAQAYDALSKNREASYYADIALKLAQKNDFYSYIQEAALILYEVYDKKEETEKALHYLKQLTAARDTLENEERVKSATKLSMQFEFDKEKQALDFEKEKETLVLNQQIQKERAIQYGAFGGVLLLSFAVFGFYRSYKIKNRDNLKIAEQANEQQKTNDQLQELSRYKEGLSHMIVHDMKNPLNVILGLTDEKTPGEEDARFINQSGKMILQLAHDIIDIQKFEEAKMQLDQEVYLLEHVINHAQQQVELLMKAKNMSFENDFSEDLTVNADIGILSRVFVNLFTNAIKYSSPGGILKVQSMDAGSSFIEVTITDSGQGIEASQLPYIFDKFWQVYAKKSGQTYSTGLGLTFCKLALEAHGGAIRAESTLDVGTTFILKTPKGNSKSEPLTLEKNASHAAVLGEEAYDEKDLTELLRIIEKIEHVPLYKAGEIDKILSNVSSDSQTVKDWVQAVKQAVLSWDQQRYDQLVRFDKGAAPPTGTG